MPSLVTCATSTIAASWRLAQPVSSCAQYLIWLAVPGTAPASAACNVCIESITASTGFTSSSTARMRSRSGEQSTSSPSRDRPSRSARSLICAGDSSPDTYSTRPAAPSRAPTCKSRVLLPMPGSPPSSATDPRMKPPPSTRSSSALPDPMRVPELGSIAARGSEKLSPPSSRPLRPPGRAPAARSRRVFHWPHSGQRPSHLGSACPQEAHT